MSWSEALAALAEPEPQAKCAAVAALWERVSSGRFAASSHGRLQVPDAGRPARPERVPPARLPRRGLGSVGGRIALLHAIAHIEFNAINLALDAALRFTAMPDDYYRDWLSVAADEARHFRMLERRLAALGAEYGDLPAHDGLWSMAEKTAGDILERMALVPRVLEARGLDVTPAMIERLEGCGDRESADCLRVILAEEIRHVAIGNRWYRWLCAQRGCDPEQTFSALLARHFPSGLKGPFNRPARIEAGFSDAELDQLATAAGAGG